MSQALRSNLLVNKVNTSENQHLSRKEVTTRSTLGTHRSVLGEIGNRAKGVPVKNASKKGTTAPDVRRPLLRSKGVTSIKQLTEAASKPKPEPVRPFSAAEEEQKLKAYSSQGLPSLDVDDIDAEDADNPQLVPEYIKDIYLYLRYLEDKFRVSEDHLRNTQLTGKMREILIDWLVQVHLKFKLLHETLYLTVAIIDRFLQVDTSVTPGQLQMVGVTAMWIASKYEEIYAPEVNDFVVIADKSFDQEQMRTMERNILNALGFSLGRPLPLHFLRRNSKAGGVDNRQHTLAKYLMELSLQEYNLAHYRVSELAAAALCLSIKVLPDETSDGWNDTLSHYSYYNEEQLRPAMCRLADLVVKANGKLSDSRAKRGAVARKYANKKFLCTSVLPELSGDVITQLAAEAPQ